MTDRPAKGAKEVAEESKLIRGHTTVTLRALDRVAVALTADTFGVAPKAVDVTVTDHHGLVGLAIATPIPMVDLEALSQHASTSRLRQQPILPQVAAAQEHLHRRFADLTGAQVGHVTIRVNGIAADESRALR